MHPTHNNEPCETCGLLDSVKQSDYGKALHSELYDMRLACCRDRYLLGVKTMKDRSQLYALWLACNWPVEHEAFAHELEMIKMERGNE